MPSKKKTPKKTPVLPDDSSGNASPLEPIADEQKGDKEHDSEVSFESMNEYEANILLDRVENLYEKQHGLLPGDQLDISTEVREAFVEMHPRLRATYYDDGACMAILELLILTITREVTRLQDRKYMQYM